MQQTSVIIPLTQGTQTSKLSRNIAENSDTCRIGDAPRQFFYSLLKAGFAPCLNLWSNDTLKVLRTTPLAALFLLTSFRGCRC
jgi:hypothetical protein